jgi:phosphohistidine phosphatase SixA
VKIVLFRHGPAEPGGRRLLSTEGRAKTRRAAEGLKRLGLGIDGIFTSPLARASETAEILGEVLGLKPVVDDRLKPGGKPLEAARGKCPVLVGHEPDLSAAAGGKLRLRKAGMALLVDGRVELLLSGKVLRYLT